MPDYVERAPAVFPNPFLDILRISGHPDKIEIFNLTGRQMPIEQAFSNSINIQLNMMNYPPGMYLLKINGTVTPIIKGQ